MLFHPWANYLKFVSPRRRPLRPRTRCACRQPARTRLALETLENRSLPSASPVPIPGLLFPTIGNPFAGPDLHVTVPGPADNTTQGFRNVGGEPSLITNFNGFIGVANVQGTGTDNSGNTLFWDTDLRFMKGVFQDSDGNIQKGTFAFV
jgi:hypothetical protein